jgi:hypothetical protein
MTPNETAERALKPCPFCGEAAECRPDDIGSGGQHVPPYLAGCWRCRLFFVEEEAPDAVVAWNRRASSPVMQNGPEGETRIVPGLGVITAVAAQDGLDVLDAMLSKVPEYAAVIEAERAEGAPAAEPAIVEAARKAEAALSQAIGFLEADDAIVACADARDALRRALGEAGE